VEKVLKDVEGVCVVSFHFCSFVSGSRVLGFCGCAKVLGWSGVVGVVVPGGSGSLTKLSRSGN
jgi:hypothetical protein